MGKITKFILDKSKIIKNNQKYIDNEKVGMYNIDIKPVKKKINCAKSPYNFAYKVV